MARKTKAGGSAIPAHTNPALGGRYVKDKDTGKVAPWRAPAPVPAPPEETEEGK